jgi:hypothetical protein
VRGRSCTVRIALMAVDPTEIDRLLRDARSAHDRAKVARMKKQDDWIVILLQARDLRQQAHELDPEHTAPIWASEFPPHLAYTDFYDKHLAPAVPVRTLREAVTELAASVAADKPSKPRAKAKKAARKQGKR